jgi:hypothetical protein
VPAGAPLSSVNRNTRVIAVDMPNVKGILRADWQMYRTSVRQIEQSTGYNLLSSLPPEVQDSLEPKLTMPVIKGRFTASCGRPAGRTEPSAIFVSNPETQKLRFP